MRNFHMISVLSNRLRVYLKATDELNACNTLMPGGNKRSYVVKQTCLSMYELFLPPGIN